jgi:hypothetical protein
VGAAQFAEETLGRVIDLAPVSAAMGTLDPTRTMEGPSGADDMSLLHERIENRFSFPSFRFCFWRQDSNSNL